MASVAESLLQLYSADDRYQAVIARFNRSRRVPASSAPSNAADPSDVESLTPTLVNRPSTRTPATLVLTPRATEIQDTIVTSFVFLEKTRRINETEQMNRADVLSAPQVAVSLGPEYRAHNGGIGG